MRRVLIAIAVLAVTALPSFAAGDASSADMKGKMRQMMQQHPEMRQEMMRNPAHLLMMSYHKTVMIFGQALARVARQGDTVPRDFARTAVAEMQRSVQEMEKYRAEGMRGMPAQMQHGEMQKMMDEHLVSVKTHLSQLQDLTNRDRIPSQEVLKHLDAIFQGCNEMGCGPMRGEPPCQQKGGCQHDCLGGPCGENYRGKPGYGCDKRAGMMPGHPEMGEMVQKMKAQDAELQKQVEKMRRAPRDKKVDLMADIVAQLVQQRADLTAHMEKMQRHMMQRHGAAERGVYHPNAQQYTPPPPPGPMGDDDEDMDMNDMDMNDVTE